MMRLLSDSSARGASSAEQRGILLSPSWRTGGLILALILLPTASRTQPHKLDTPTDSPLWWTLTDEITPQKLKALYADRASSLARYDDAVEAGLEEPLPARGKRSRACLIFYRNAELTPQLEPMWIAFRAFYNAHLDRELGSNEYVDAVPHRLQEFGISPSGVDVILAAAKFTKAEVKRRLPEFIPRIGDAALLIDEIYSDPIRAASAPPIERFRDAMEARDYATVSAVTSRPESEIRELVDSYANWNVPYELVAEALPVLKNDLSEPDWEGFRRYLLEVVVSGFGSAPHFEDYCG